MVEFASIRNTCFRETCVPDTGSETSIRFAACIVKRKGIGKMTQKRILILAAVMLAGAVAGRLAVRGGINLLIGGTLSGGNFL